MTPPNGSTVVDFDPHVIWALVSLFLALAVTLLVIAAGTDNKNGRR
jgi:hypothetical protein